MYFLKLDKTKYLSEFFLLNILFINSICAYNLIAHYHKLNPYHPPKRNDDNVIQSSASLPVTREGVVGMEGGMRFLKKSHRERKAQPARAAPPGGFLKCSSLLPLHTDSKATDQAGRGHL